MVVLTNLFGNIRVGIDKGLIFEIIFDAIEYLVGLTLLLTNDLTCASVIFKNTLKTEISVLNTIGEVPVGGVNCLVKSVGDEPIAISFPEGPSIEYSEVLVGFILYLVFVIVSIIKYFLCVES